MRHIDVAKDSRRFGTSPPPPQGLNDPANPAPNLAMGPFTYHDCSKPLKDSVPLPPAHYFGDVDPQPMPVITTEIASGTL